MQTRTQAGRDNKRALDGIARSALGVITQMRETGASEEAVSKKSASMRDALIKTATRFGT